MSCIMASFVIFIFLCDLVLAGTGDATTTMVQPANDGCTSIRVINLVLYGFYDESLVESRKKFNATENITEYLYLLAKAAGELHFKNISCTNISLILAGAKFLEKSSDVEQLGKYESLEVNATLDRFQKYWLQQRNDLGNPDVGILFTAQDFENNSKLCDEVLTNFEEDASNDRDGAQAEYDVYCEPLTGVAYFKGACSDYSVALVSEDGGVFRGTTPLAKAIATLLGARFDTLRRDEKCTDGEITYLTTKASQFIVNPQLSKCAKADIMDFIECVETNQTNVCWKDIPQEAVMSNYDTPFNFFQHNDFCGRYYSGNYRCPGGKDASDYPGCYMHCCGRDYNGVEINVTATTTPYGKECGKGGMCFADGCF